MSKDCKLGIDQDGSVLRTKEIRIQKEMTNAMQATATGVSSLALGGCAVGQGAVDAVATQVMRFRF